MKTTKEIKKANKRFEELTKFLTKLRDENKCEIDLPYYATSEQTSFEDLESDIQDNNGFDIEIIYYSRAMQYLSENDNSLNCSMELAADMGFQPKNINSELLASLLATEIEREKFYELKSEIEKFFEELNEKY